MSLEVLRGACIPDDEYMQQVRNLCGDNPSWSCDYTKSNISVFSKFSNTSNIKIIKLVHVFKDVPADLLFDTLMDTEYRKVWDKNMVESFELCHINPNNDIGYYALRSFPAICDRDFVLQRSWLQTGSEFIITNRSIFHKALPPRKQYIRALSYLTAYLIRTRGSNSCELTYVSHCDPRGKLPAWAVNKATQYVAPRVIKRLCKACHNYTAWKRTNRPDFKPWLNPEQLETPRVDWTDILTEPDIDVSGDVAMDESNAVDVTSNGNGVADEGDAD
ncbi:hypothetical protein EG68_00069 [Paragonimus skrjabini miyazakii]|uniref:START domain-containing protein 10 n=1 Tax=Paragonimus skrjabini miyazakii TaxID=59628 RepID=A0A8S9ZA56_9TREM|nr:hypothetical protein EG68_00069 [Paragonimus skrjabini miyazakii]